MTNARVASKTTLETSEVETTLETSEVETTLETSEDENYTRNECIYEKIPSENCFSETPDLPDMYKTVPNIIDTPTPNKIRL